jgi:hypothetical protein
MSIFVIRAFIRLRAVGRMHAQLAAQFEALEHRVSGHDKDLEYVFAALRKLIEPSRKPRRRIGFGLPVTLPMIEQGESSRCRIRQRDSTIGKSMKLARPDAR